MKFIDNRKENILYGTDDCGFDEYDVSTEEVEDPDEVALALLLSNIEKRGWETYLNLSAECGEMIKHIDALLVLYENKDNNVQEFSSVISRLKEVTHLLDEACLKLNQCQFISEYGEQ